MSTIAAFITERIAGEPVMTQSLIQVFVVMLVAFGLRLSPEQIAAVVGFSAVLLGWLTRSKVTPV